MHISLTAFVYDLQYYLTNHPSAVWDEAQSSLTALGERTFENAEEAGLTLTAFVETVQKSNNEDLKAVVRHLFEQAIQKLSSDSPTEERPAKRQHRKSTHAKTGFQNLDQAGFQNLDQDCLAHIFGFLHPKDQSQVGAVCRTWHEVLGLQQYCDLVGDPILSSFGMSIPSKYTSLKESEAAWNDIFAKLSIILKGIHDSYALNALSVEETTPFFKKTPQEIVNAPNLWRHLLHTAYELSLVSPFLYGRNLGPQGPFLIKGMPLAEKAEAIRNHLKEKGDTFTELLCSDGGLHREMYCGYPICEMLCFPIEFCSLQNLRHLSLSYNQIAFLPPQIRQLKALESLNISHNQLTSLPSEIGQLVALQEFAFDYNQITVLPPAITGFTQRISIYLRGNPLTTIPKFPENIQAILT